MLFLAVFCGFLAENFREHRVESHRGKKYIQSLIEDLKNDTAEVNAVIAFNITKLRGLDTLATLLNQPTLNEIGEKELYRLNSKYASNINTLTFHDRTMRQLLNSGNMRLIEQSVSDTIMNFYGQAKDEIISQEDVYEEMSKRLIFFAEDVFDKSVSPLKIRDDYSFYREDTLVRKSLLTREKSVLKKYAQAVTTAQGMLAVYLDLIFDIKNKADRLIPYLRKEYHLN